MTRDEFLLTVSQCIRSNLRPDEPMKAATLGNLLIRAVPETWRQHAFTSFKELLSELELRGVVRIGTDASGHLSITATGATPPIGVQAQPEQRLRREVWAAFVNALPAGRRYYQRSSGQVVLGQQYPPASTAGWIEIARISDDVQKNWARSFLDAHELNFRHELDQALWFARVPDELHRTNPMLVPQWHANRTKRVLEFVALWARDNAIDFNKMLADTSGTARKSKPDNDVRRRILSALERMTTAELLDIPIRARYLFPSDSNRNS